MLKHRIHRLGPHDPGPIPQVADLINDALGQGSCKPDDLLRQLRDTDQFGVFTARATRTDGLLGAAITQILDDDSYLSWRARNGLSDVLPADPPSAQGRRIGYGQYLTVRPDMQGNGIGGTLVRHAMDWVRSHQGTDFYAALWIDQSSARAQEIAHRRGATLMAEIPGYWTEESVLDDWHCPRCGQPCHCNAYLIHTKLTPTPHQV